MKKDEIGNKSGNTIGSCCSKQVVQIKMDQLLIQGTSRKTKRTNRGSTVTSFILYVQVMCPGCGIWGLWHTLAQSRHLLHHLFTIHYWLVFNCFILRILTYFTTPWNIDLRESLTTRSFTSMFSMDQRMDGWIKMHFASLLKKIHLNIFYLYEFPHFNWQRSTGRWEMEDCLGLCLN